MNALKKNLPLIVKILIAALFLLSAIAKSFPIWAFEKQLVDLGIVDWCKAPYLARLIDISDDSITIKNLKNNDTIKVDENNNITNNNDNNNNNIDNNNHIIHKYIDDSAPVGCVPSINNNNNNNKENEIVYFMVYYNYNCCIIYNNSTY